VRGYSSPNAQRQFDSPNSASRGGYGGSSNSYNRTPLNMRQPIVTPRGGYNESRGNSAGNIRGYSAPRGAYSGGGYSAPRSYNAPSAPRGGNSGGGYHGSPGGGGGGSHGGGGGHSGGGRR
jgi:hypothetical protein